MQGAGAALLFPTGLALLAAEFAPGAERARAIGIWGASVSAAIALGPLLGGLLVQGLGWRAIFAMPAALAIPTGVVAFRHLREHRPVRAPPVDWLGTGALTTAVTSVLGTSFVALTFAAAGFGPIVFLTLYLLEARGASPTLAGLELAPFALASLLVSLGAARVAARLGVRMTLVAGLLGCAAGLALLLGLGADSSYVRMLPGLLLFGVGAGLVNPTMTVAALTAVDVEHAGMASGVNNACRQLGIAAGIAGLGAVLEARRVSVTADGAVPVDAFLAGLDAALLVATAVAVLGTAVIARLLRTARPS